MSAGQVRLPPPVSCRLTAGTAVKIGGEKYVGDPLQQLALSNYAHAMKQPAERAHVDVDNPDYTRYKWCLGCFDRTTERLVWSRDLPITSADTRRVLDLGPSDSLEDGFFLSNAAADRLNEILGDKIAFEFEKFEYDIELTDTL